MTWRIQKYVVTSIWWPNAMETTQDGYQTQLFKKLKLQSHRMKINFLFTVHTNIMLSSLLPRILWLLCSSFILFYYLHFMLVKMISIFQIGINLKQILPSTNRLVKVKINTYTNCTQTFKTLRSYNLEKGIKVRLWENVHEKKKSILPDMNPLDIWQIMHVKDTMHAK